ncbi:hypothetical protein HZC27_05870 [Candidatus Roizmanbacteria bacterium]|nr:hypothetical protein [Candidatus Roizmanbacteria bacterium]
MDKDKLNKTLLFVGIFFSVVVLGELLFLFSNRFNSKTIIRNITNLTSTEADREIKAGILIVKPDYYYKLTEYEGVVGSINKDIKHKGLAGKADWVSTDILLEKKESKWELREKDILRTVVVRDEGKKGKLEKLSLGDINKGDLINIKIGTEPFGDGKYKMFFVMITKLN